MAFIIDTYNKYDAWDRNHQRRIFEINGQWYAVLEVELEWGVPQLAMRIGQEKNPETYFIYNSLEDALRFVQRIRSLN